MNVKVEILCTNNETQLKMEYSENENIINTFIIPIKGIYRNPLYWHDVRPVIETRICVSNKYTHVSIHSINYNNNVKGAEETIPWSNPYIPLHWITCQTNEMEIYSFKIANQFNNLFWNKYMKMRTYFECKHDGYDIINNYKVYYNQPHLFIS